MGTPTEAISSKGIQLLRGDGGGSEVFTAVAEVSDINGPSFQNPQLDASNFDSAMKEWIGGLADGGEVSGTCNFIGSDEQQQGLWADSISGVRRNFKLVFPDDDVSPTTIAFAALVTKPPVPKAGTDAVVKADFSLKVTGEPTITWAP